jgi:hypothetical protein
MKISNQQLRQIIREVISEGRKIIVDPRGEAFVASDAYTTGAAKDAQSFGYNPKLDKLKSGTYSGDALEDMRQGRDLATAMDLQDELSIGEETAQEMGQQSAMKPDLSLKNLLPAKKSIEFSQYLKRECEKRGLECAVQDTRHKKPDKPHIVVSVKGVHPLRYEDIDAEVYLNDHWSGSIEIEIRAHYPDAPAGLPKVRHVELTPGEVSKYLDDIKDHLHNKEDLATLIIDSASEL